MVHEETLKSMSVYWEEVMKREDKSPLTHELEQVSNMLGPERMLRMVMDFINRPVLEYETDDNLLTIHLKGYTFNAPFSVSKDSELNLVADLIGKWMGMEVKKICDHDWQVFPANDIRSECTVCTKCGRIKL